MASNQLTSKQPKKPRSRKGARTYDTRLRAEQAELTRQRIIQAYGEAVARNGDDEITIKQIAEIAGVSIPTLYRNFSSLEELGDAYWAIFEAKLGPFDSLKDPDELPGFVEQLFARFTEFEPQMKALFESRAGMRMRDRSAPRRNKNFQTAVASLTRNLPEREAIAATAMCKIMSSGQVWRILHGEWGLDGEESGRAVSWALRTLLKEIRRNPKSLTFPKSK